MPLFVLIFHKFTYLFQCYMLCYCIQYLQMVFFSYNYLFLLHVSSMFLYLSVDFHYVPYKCLFVCSFNSTSLGIDYLVCVFLFIVLTPLECRKSSFSVSIYCLWLPWLTPRQSGKCSVPSPGKFRELGMQVTWRTPVLQYEHSYYLH